MNGVLDRFEGNQAVILVEKEAEEFTIEKEQLPEGSTVGTWFHVAHGTKGYSVVSIDTMKTEEQSTANALLMEKLRKRKKTSKLKREDQ